MTKEEIVKITSDFSEEFGELTMLRANIAAINRLIINSGKEQTLYANIVESIELFKKENIVEERKK